MSIENILNLIRPEIRKIEQYKSAKNNNFSGNLISMSANENPFCFKENENYNRYPELLSKELIERMAKIYGVLPENLIYGRGSSEIIELLIKVFCTPYKDSAIICSPTFIMYEKILEISSVNCKNIKLNDNFQLNVEKIIEEGKDKNTKLIIIPNPNAPLGHFMNKNDLLKIIDELQNDCYIVIDEAYIEFTDKESYIKYINKYDNICILRTLSKYYGLAGLRIGSFIGNKEIRNIISRVLPPYSTPAVCYNIALEALEDKNQKFFIKNKNTIIEEREKIYKKLKELPFIENIYPSETNFILFTSKNRDEIINYLANNGILIRPQESEIKNSARISIGSPEDNLKLLNLLDTVIKGL
ncbi:MAG TPA: histidinol-phosphate transaminase [Rickettsiales bacterium]|nr:histidinol-phosphate transaminase [Rickettsiales bacterium]